MTTHLIINKTVVNDSGGTLTAAAFSGTIGGAVVATGGNTWTGATTDRTLTTVGTYSVAETAQAGYTASFSADCSGTIAAGETRTCTVTNNDNATHLIINKTVVNDSGGSSTAAAFSGTISGAVVATGGNTWAGASTDRSLTTVGTYSVAETAQAGYTATFSADCSGTIAVGETRTCTVTNNDLAAGELARLIINKTVVNDSGGTLTAADFSGTIGGAVVATGGNTWAGASTDRPLTTVGAYSVAETAQAGYTATFSADCSGTIAAGETKTCTVTNNDNATHLIINKTVINNSGGSSTAAAFSGTIGGAVVATGGNTWTGASTDRSLTTVGAYSVAEAAQTSYSATFSADCSGTIAVGETRTCTVTNDDLAAGELARLIINKTVVNDSGGTLTAADFSGTIGGAVVAMGGNTWTGASTARTLTTVGAYSVAETAQAGYTATFSADCSGTIAVGETKICTVTNNDIAGVPTLPQVFVVLLGLGLTGVGYLRLRRRTRVQ